MWILVQLLVNTNTRVNTLYMYSGIWRLKVNGFYCYFYTNSRERNNDKIVPDKKSDESVTLGVTVLALMLHSKNFYTRMYFTLYVG